MNLKVRIGYGDVLILINLGFGQQPPRIEPEIRQGLGIGETGWIQASVC